MRPPASPPHARAKSSWTFEVVITGAPAGWFVASVPRLAGCHAQGRSVAEAKERVKEAIHACLATHDGGSARWFLGVESVTIEP